MEAKDEKPPYLDLFIQPEMFWAHTVWRKGLYVTLK